MLSKLTSAAVVALAASGLVSAQTSTLCNPTKQSCPPDPAFGESVNCDFSKGPCDAFKTAEATTIKYDQQGAVYTINGAKDAPTCHTPKYIFFGSIEVELQAAPGKGIVTSVVLQSDDLDEIDLEWIGSEPGKVQSNYFSKGDDKTYDRGGTHAVADATGKMHTYKIDWTPDAVTWSIDSNAVRTLNKKDAKGGSGYPQTPMQIKLGTWVAGGPDSPEGTATWAGGRTDFSQKPFVGIYKSIKIVDFGGKNAPSQGGIKEYTYGDNTGSAESIKVVQGKSERVNGENGAKDNEDNTSGSGSSSHDESKTLSDSPSATENSASSGTGGARSGGGGAGGRSQSTMSTATGAPNATSSARPTSAPGGGSPGSTTPTSDAGFVKHESGAFGALALAAVAAFQFFL